MKMFVVGVQKVDFVPKDSDTPIRGVKVHVVKDCNKSQSFVIGRVVDTIFISSSNPLSDFDFKVDKYYDFHKLNEYALRESNANHQSKQKNKARR